MTALDHPRLLLAILRERWDEAARIRARGPVDPALFVALCSQADVPTWVHWLIERRDGPELVGRETFAQLAEIRSRVRRDNLLLLARAEQALDLLARAGLRPVALKGLDLLHRVYPSFDLRTLDDVDLLVRPEELKAAVEALAAGGFVLPPEPARTHYVRSSHHLPLSSPGPLPVEFELHWNLAQETRYAIDGPSLLARAVPCDIGGRAALRLADHDMAAHLLLHHLAHYFDRRLKWAVDLHLVSQFPGFRFDAVAERMCEWDARATAGAALLHLRKLFPEWIPPDLTRRLPLAAWRRAALLPLRSRHPLDLFRGTRRRFVQLWIATALLDRPAVLPRWLAWRAIRDRRPGANPLDKA